MSSYELLLPWAQSATDGSIVVLQKSAERIYRCFLLNSVSASVYPLGNLFADDVVLTNQENYDIIDKKCLYIL
jgi:hypothetical protein